MWTLFTSRKQIIKQTCFWHATERPGSQARETGAGCCEFYVNGGPLGQLNGMGADMAALQRDLGMNSALSVFASTFTPARLPDQEKATTSVCVCVAKCLDAFRYCWNFLSCRWWLAVALCVKQKKNSVKIWNKKWAPLFWSKHSMSCLLLYCWYFSSWSLQELEYSIWT